MTKHNGRNVRWVIAILLTIVVVFLVLPQGGNLLSLGPTSNILNPGVEGAKSGCYGVIITSGANYNPAWTGLNTMHFVGANERPIASAGISNPSESYYWGPGSGASQFTIQHFAYKYYMFSPTVLTENQLSTEVESNIQLQDFSYQNPTVSALQGTNNPTQGVYLQYWTQNATQNADGTTTYTYATQDILLVPGDFHINVWLVPSQDHANTGSGWEEGSWSNVELWYTIYWYDWLNALAPYVQNNPTPPDIPANATNRQTLFNYRGGVPISAWIQNYYMPIQTSSGTTYDLLKVSTSDKNTLAGVQLPSDVLQNLQSMVQNGMTPSLGGRYLDLYTQPSDTFQYVNLNPSNPVSTGVSRVPDAQTQLPQEYFKIGVLGLGTNTVAHGLLGTGPYTVYYPEVSYLVRVVMGVYGQHTYVWTVGTATQSGYNSNSTSGFVNRTIESTTGGSGINWPWAGLNFNWGDLFSPLNFEIIGILVVIVVIIVTVANPGLWVTLAQRKKK
jgi:hypothetical protein